MRTLLLVLALLALQQSDCDPAPVQQQSGYTVRLCSERDMSNLIAYSNQWLAQTAPDVRFVQSSNGCDVTVEIGQTVVPHANGESYAITGEITLAPGSDGTTLMHEILHCAGLPHENDRTSVMYKYSGGASLLHAHHVEALRRLAGVTPFGRVTRQIGSWQEPQ